MVGSYRMKLAQPLICRTGERFIYLCCSACQWKGGAAVVLNAWPRRDWLSDWFMARRPAHDVVINVVANVQLIQLLGQRLWARMFGAALGFARRTCIRVHIHAATEFPVSASWVTLELLIELNHRSARATNYNV
jgi:hypothetical protein